MVPINLNQNGGSLPLQLIYTITLMFSGENVITVKTDRQILE